MRAVWRWRAAGLVCFPGLTILTQIGGVVLLLAVGLARAAPHGWHRGVAATGPPAVLTLRWNLAWLQSKWPAMPLDPARTRSAIDWIVRHGDGSRPRFS